MRHDEVRYLGLIPSETPGQDPPVVRPVDLAAIRGQLGFSSSFSADRLESLLDQAVAICEKHIGARIRLGRYEAVYSGFPAYDRALDLPGWYRGAAAISYWSSDDRSQQVLDASMIRAQISGRTHRAAISPISGRWPQLGVTWSSAPRVIVQYQAGIRPEECPPEIQGGIISAIRWIHDEAEVARMQMHQFLAGWSYV